MVAHQLTDSPLAFEREFEHILIDLDDTLVSTGLQAAGLHHRNYPSKALQREKNCVLLSQHAVHCLGSPHLHAVALSG
jgi:hypothetical protein